MRILAIIAIIVSVLDGCAPARVVEPGKLIADTSENAERLRRIVPRLAAANAEICRDTVIGVIRLERVYHDSCDLSVGVARRLNTLNAFTDGRNIALSPAMMAFASRDEELALVIGHEVGHIIERHVQTTMIAASLGAFIDGLAAGQGISTGGAFQQIGARIFSPSREREADRWGMFLAARAGFSVDGIPDFWSRMPHEDGGFLATHPSSAERVANFHRLAAEIRYRKLNGLGLNPSEPEPPAFVASLR